MQNQILTQLLGIAVKGDKINEKSLSGITPELFSCVMNLAELHGVESVIVNALEKEGFDDSWQHVINAYQKKQLYSVVKTTRLEFEESALFGLLNGAGFSFMAVKGSVIRSLYPKSQMRSSCDIDVFVEKNSQKGVCQLLESNGYKRVKDYKDEITYISSSKQSVELHFDFAEGEKAWASLFEKVWEKATQFKEYEFGKKLCPEDVVIYHLIHIAKHLLGGGSGIKTILDTYILESKLEYDKEVVERRLKEVGLDKLYKEVIALKDYWFNDKDASETTRKLGDFIISGGAYGSDERKNQIKKGKGKIRYALSRAFPSFGELKTTYPVLVKCAVLYPFCIVARWISFIFGKKTKKETNAARFEGKEIARLLKDLGVK